MIGRHRASNIVHSTNNKQAMISVFYHILSYYQIVLPSLMVLIIKLLKIVLQALKGKRILNKSYGFKKSWYFINRI